MDCLDCTIREECKTSQTRCVLVWLLDHRDRLDKLLEGKTLKVVIPFLERFREPMLNGTKIMTTRSKRYGWQGDTFDAFGTTFQLEQVYIASLSWIAKYRWKEEGCSSEQDFIDAWKSIHHKLNDPRSQWHVHVFKQVKEVKS